MQTIPQEPFPSVKLYENLGVCHDKLGNSDSALHYLQASLAMFEADDRQNHARAYAMSMLGVARLHAGQTRAAIAICDEGLALAQELADLPMQEQCYSCLYQAHQEMGNAEKALPMYQRYVAVRDSITGEQRAKELIRIEVTYDFERLQLADSLKQVDARRQAEFAYQQRLSRERRSEAPVDPEAPSASWFWPVASGAACAT